MGFKSNAGGQEGDTHTVLLCIATTPSINTLLNRDPFSNNDARNTHDT